MSTFNLQNEKLNLCIDRTNWKFGQTHINYLVISVVYGKNSIPIVWKLLTDKKCGNSNFLDRKTIINDLLDYIPSCNIYSFLADREFLSAKLSPLVNTTL